LLQRPEFADYQALKWADLLRVDRQALGHEKAYAFYKWIRESFAANKPLDQFARELITAEGPLAEVGPANFFKVANKPGEAASSLSQIFLGVRIACAECHHHPFDRWTQSDYYGLAAYFTPVGVRKIGVSEAIIIQGDATAKHLRTGVSVRATPLAGKSANATKGDLREELA